MNRYFLVFAARGSSLIPAIITNSDRASCWQCAKPFYMPKAEMSMGKNVGHYIHDRNNLITVSRSQYMERTEEILADGKLEPSSDNIFLDPTKRN